MPIPMDWIDKLFLCMEQFYGERWSNQFWMLKQDFAKKMWKSGLEGLNYDEIKATLQILRRHAQDPNNKPPHQMEFFKYAKGQAHPRIDYYEAKPKSSAEVAEKTLKEIREKFHGRKNAQEISADTK